MSKVVKVQHRSNGNGRMVQARPVYAKVVQEYVNGEVIVEGFSDVWQVRPSKDPKAQLETYIPGRE